MPMKLRDTEIGREYWYAEDCGPYRRQADARRAARLFLHSSVERRVFLVVRLEDSLFVDRRPGVISKRERSDQAWYQFRVLDQEVLRSGGG
ncbi:hypothetical protein Thimo_1907 [Thioflavicoccus mobilis 8321]|uniref:Uncharacterized protein n=1 Tax=Thioflavicoccus mobilis 8321 TaxID=765912 RepID=L0GV93_9GAMM|nr:hypothetical protein Thimo_1907 [Thioflavicoccus mobilis 8321]